MIMIQLKSPPKRFLAVVICQKWVGDIIYISRDTGWLYLTIVIDLTDRKIIAYSFSEDLTAINTTVQALQKGIEYRGVQNGLLLHFDRWVQDEYACKEFTILLQNNGITQSMSRKGNCWDNAVAESFFKALKSELIYHKHFLNKAIAKLEIVRYIEIFYPSKRIHSALGGRTPNENGIFIL